MQDDIVGQGVELLVYGMATVVVFLALLVVITTAMSRLVTRYFPEAELAAAAPLQKATASRPDNDPQLIAAISGAVHRHRANRE